MPVLPTIPNCVRITLNWNTSLGVTPRNVFHIITASTSGEEIGAALDEVFEAGAADAFQAMDDSYTLESYGILVLDGTSATQDVPSDAALQGGGSGEMVPAAAAVISLRSNQRGPRGRGRQFVGPCSEAALTDGIIVSSYRDAMVGAWNALDDGLASTDIAGSLGIASYTHAEVHGVTSISCRPPAGTQRRRQNQLVH
jgi:hypothetical protein